MLTLTTATGKQFTGTVRQLKSLAIQPARIACSSCALAVINGVPCHELGCPDAWRDEVRQCRWCGSEFTPAWKGQGFCGNDCHAYYNGWEVDSDRVSAEDDTSP